MTNFEKYKDEILELGRIGSIAFNGNIVYCSDINCCECRFSSEDCQKTYLHWLYDEYKVELNEDERKLLELAKDGLIARNGNGDLFIFKFEDEYDKFDIRKDDGEWTFINYYKVNLFSVDTLCNPNLKFDFIKWEDDEPYDIKELLNNQ